MRTIFLFRFLKVMFSGFAALLWAAGILCFVATAIQVGQGEMIDWLSQPFFEVLTNWSICRLTTTSTMGLLLW